jgi:hypothetical protein
MVQPLQVNFSNRGAQHELSVNFATAVRNKVIDMCNKAQESLTKLINYELQYSSAKQNFVDKAVFSIEFIDYLIKILDVLYGAFLEIDVFTERLKKDKLDFSNLKSELNKILNQIDPYNTYRNKSYRKKEKQQTETYSYNTSTYNKPKTTQSSSQSDETWTNAIRWIVGITILVAFIGMIVSFSSDGGSTAIGVISLIIGIITAVCAYKWGQRDIELDMMKPVSIALAIIMGIVCIASASINSSNSSDNDVYTSSGITLTSSNFYDYFTLTSSCSVSGSGSYRTATYSYSISPKSSFHYSYYSDNPSSISVTIGLDISSISTSYGTPSEYKIYVTLYKSSGYKTSGSRSYSISSYDQYSDDGIYYVSGTIYN